VVMVAASFYVGRPPIVSFEPESGPPPAA
jgi:hypothetical protein